MSIKEELSRLNLVADSSRSPLRSSRSSDLIVPTQVLVHASFSQLIFARYFINEFLILRSGDARRFAAPTVVERFFAWIGRNRRLAKDFQASIDSARAFLYAVPVMLLSRRIARHE